MNNQLKKVISLAKKTGERLIVFDPNDADSAYVIMPVEEYERMALGNSGVRDLTEDELLDKINRDIAIWKNEQKDRMEMANNTKISDNNANRDAFDWRLDDDIDYINDMDYGNNGYEVRPDRQKRTKTWKIPAERKEGAEEIIEEDRQYLEKIPF